MAWLKFHKHKTCGDKLQCLCKIVIKIFRRFDFSNCIIWFEFTAFGRVANSITQCGSAWDASCCCWLGGCGQLRLERYHAQDEQKIEDSFEFIPRARSVGFLFKRQFRFAARVAGSNRWTGFAALWDLCGNWQTNFNSMRFRTRGRLQQKCDNMLRKLCENL